MKISILMIVAVVTVSLFTVNANAQNNQWLEGILIELENFIGEIDGKIEKTKNEIKTNDERIQKAEKTITTAKKKNDEKLLFIGEQTLRLATEAKKENTEFLNFLEKNKKNSNNALTNVKKTISSSYSNRVNSVITNFSGNVQLKKAGLDTKVYNLENENPALLESGDNITTDAGSKVEMTFFEGRGNMIIGESTQIEMKEDSSGLQTLNLIKGKIKIEVEKLEKIENDIKYWEKALEKCKDDNCDQRTYMEKQLTRLLIKLKKKFLKVERPCYNCGVVAIRGTQLIVSEDEQKGMEVIVLEGSVELSGLDKEKIVIVNEGYRASVSLNGEVSEPEKIDLSKIEKW